MELLGRDDECGTLAGLVEGARHGRGAVLVIQGEPGAGKTALLEYALGLAERVRVIRGWGTESEAELAYAGLYQVCRPLLNLLDRVTAPQRDALEIVFGMKAGAVPDRLLVGLGTLSLLTEAATQQPLVCAIEDVHRLDEESAQALIFAARRLPACPMLMIFTARKADTDLAGLPSMELGGLRDADAGDLLATVTGWPLDERVRGQILAETRGNPGALVELLRGVSPEQLAGGFGLPDVLQCQIADGQRRQVGGLPTKTQLLLLVAAAEPTGDPVTVWRAAAYLGISAQAGSAAAEAGLLTLGTRIVFRDLLTRCAAYRSASPPDRQAAHQALTQALDQRSDPDRRAWHQALSAPGPDEEVAADLEGAADHARAHAGVAACAAFLQRAAILTPDSPRRSRRALAAAVTMLESGMLDAAARMLDMAEPGALDDHQRARADLVRAQLARVSSQGGDAPPLLLDAAGRLARFDAAEARAAYLDATDAAMFAAGLASAGGTLSDVARTAQGAPRAHSPGTADLLLDGLASCFIDGYRAGAPILRRALSGFGRDMTPAEELHWLRPACNGAVWLWDDQAWEALSSRRVRLARDAGALGHLPQALHSHACARLLAGELGVAESLTEEARAAAETAGSAPTPCGSLGLAALRGRADQALALIDSSARDAARHGEGLGVTVAKWAAAVLHNGAGRYGEALSAAKEAVAYASSPTGPEMMAAGSPMAGWAVTELIEAAVRSGSPDQAAEPMRYLSETASAVGTSWVVGIQARSQGLLSDGECAERLYRTAIEHLGRTRARVDLARAHLVYGEWLRRENRRVDAREQLRAAHHMLDEMGVHGFAERARRELQATGETVRKRTVETDRNLTPQETQIAVRARDGHTNSEIGAELFLSPRTVEWHMRKVFAKLGITSRRQLRETLPVVGERAADFVVATSSATTMSGTSRRRRGQDGPMRLRVC
ncbi:MAG TPA: AAA family ATPase [Trebonia sp.]